LEKEQETQRLKAIIEGEEKERKRLARELHDGLGAVLATVKMQISGIQRKFPTVQTSETYQKAESLIDDACRTVREVSHDLMPYVLEQQGLFSAIEEMCQNLSRQHDTSFDFISFGDEAQLNDVLTITLYRITQELLKNILKHAEATEVIVQLTIEDEEIMLIVEDDGKGFDTSLQKKGIGLDNIYSRTAYLKGTLDIDSTIGQGSTFTILLPTQQNKVTDD
jgi:signal transduction histidine kinase